VVRTSFLHTYIITVQLRLFNAWGSFSLSLHSVRMLRVAQKTVLFTFYTHNCALLFNIFIFQVHFHILSPLSLVAFYSQAISRGFVRIV
jgi:hypothetical protein